MCGCTSSPCGCATPNIPRGPRGYQGEPGPAPSITIGTVTTGAPGSSAAATITGATPNLTLSLTIPQGPAGATGAAGANGQDATELFTGLTSFTVPSLNTSSVATVGDTSWMVAGGWLYINGAGYFNIVNVLSPTTVQLANPGSVLGWPAGIPGQASPGTVVPSDATTNQVIQAAVPGLPGATGDTGPGGSNGPSGFIEVVNTIPTVAPAPGGEFKIYTNSSTNPTVITGYSWNGAVWAATANLTPAAGSRIFNQIGVPGSGVGNNGDWSFDPVSLEVYYKSAGSWTNPFDLSATFTQVATASSGDFGAIPVRTQSVIGYVPETDTISAPGTYTMDLQYTAFHLQVDKNITLDWDDTLFPYNAQWELQVENVDGSSINLDIAASKFAEDSGLSLSFPLALAAGNTRVFILRKNMAGDRLIIENTYEVNNL